VKLQQLVAALFRDRQDPSAPFRGIARHGKDKASLSKDPDGVDVLLGMERPWEGCSGNLPQEFQGHDLLLMLLGAKKMAEPSQTLNSCCANLFVGDRLTKPAAASSDLTRLSSRGCAASPAEPAECRLAPHSNAQRLDPCAALRSGASAPERAAPLITGRLLCCPLPR
jgi:hypothetical protein